MQFKKHLIGLAILGASVSAFASTSLLPTITKTPEPAYEISLPQAKILGCEISFREGGTYHNPTMNIGNIVYYTHRGNENEVKFVFSDIVGRDYSILRFLSVTEKEKFLVDFAARRNICSFSPIQPR